MHNTIKSATTGRVIREKKYNKCPNPNCTKNYYHHTREEAKECEGVAMDYEANR